MRVRGRDGAGVLHACKYQGNWVGFRVYAGFVLGCFELASRAVEI